MAGITLLETRADSNINVNIDELLITSRKNRVAKATLVYIGCVARKMLQKYDNCKEWGNLLHRPDGDVPSEIIQVIS